MTWGWQCWYWYVVRPPLAWASVCVRIGTGGLSWQVRRLLWVLGRLWRQFAQLRSALKKDSLLIDVQEVVA